LLDKSIDGCYRLFRPGKILLRRAASTNLDVLSVHPSVSARPPASISTDAPKKVAY